MHKFFNTQLITLIILCFPFASCSTYLSAKQPLLLNRMPCSTVEKSDRQFHAFAAIVQSLQDRRWGIMNIGEYTVAAQYCRGRHCTELNVSVDSNGAISISRNYQGNISLKYAKLLRKWMAYLEKSYNRYRCETAVSLEEKVKKFGISRPR